MGTTSVQYGKTYYARIGGTIRRVIPLDCKFGTCAYQCRPVNGTRVILVPFDAIISIAPDKPTLDLSRIKPGNPYHLLNSACKRLSEADLSDRAAELRLRVTPDKNARPEYSWALGIVGEYCDVIAAPEGKS